MFPPPQESNLSLEASKPAAGVLSTEFTKLHWINAESKDLAPPQGQHGLLPTYLAKGKDKPGSHRARVILLATFVSIFGICAIFALSLGSIHEWIGLFRRLGNRTGVIDGRKSSFLSRTQGGLGEQWPSHDEWTSRDCEHSWNVTRVGGWAHSRTNITLNTYTRSHLLAAENANGHITFTVSPQHVEHILVRVDATSLFESAFKAVKVCKIRKADGSEGLFFSVTEKWARIFFNATVYLPRQSFKDFETDMRFWSHTFEDLRDDVSFDSLRVQSSPSPIVSRGLSANRAYLKTTDAIGGQFRVYEALKLETRDGAIRADVEMLYHPDSSHDMSALYMKSETGLINATTKLMHARERDRFSTGGIYNINAFTGRGKVELKVLDSPLLSHLTLLSESSESNSVTLHPSYEGSFAAHLGSSFGNHIQMHTYGPHDDPAGEGRARTFSISDDTPDVLAGNAYWSYDNRDEGSVVVKSSYSTVDLTV